MFIKNLSLFVLLFSGLLQFKATAQNKGFMDFNGYYDTREFSVLTLNLLAKLPNRIQYFSLTNYQGPSKSSDLSNFYSEQNLRWGVSKDSPIDATIQYVIRNKTMNDDLRFGFRWRLHNTSIIDSFFHKMNMTYSVNPMLVQLREKTSTKILTLVEHVYNINILPRLFNDRMYLGGFADHNMQKTTNGKIRHNWVTEHQLGFRIIDQLYIISEYRINTFLQNKQQNGLGYGFEYKIKF